MRGLERFEPVALDDLALDVRLAERVERKYIVDRALACALLERLAATHHVLEVAGERAGRYRSVYYDTPDLLCVREHLQGRRRRFKCRRREYLETGHSVVELKVKGRRGRTVKHVLDRPGSRALDAEAEAFLAARLREAYGRELPPVLEPALTVSCRRITLVGRGDPERVTLDVLLHYGRHMLAPGFVIVETKGGDRPGRGDAELRRLGARRQSWCSKYCIGVSLERRGPPDNELRRVLRRHFVPLERTATRRRQT